MMLAYPLADSMRFGLYVGQLASARISPVFASMTQMLPAFALFRSTAYRRDETELVIIVTPYLVRPVSTQIAWRIWA